MDGLDPKRLDAHITGRDGAAQHAVPVDEYMPDCHRCDAPYDEHRPTSYDHPIHGDYEGLECPPDDLDEVEMEHWRVHGCHDRIVVDGDGPRFCDGCGHDLVETLVYGKDVRRGDVVLRPGTPPRRLVERLDERTWRYQAAGLAGRISFSPVEHVKLGVPFEVVAER